MTQDPVNHPESKYMQRPEPEALTKACSKCGEVKPFSGFNKCKGMRDGYRSECKECRKEYRKETSDRIKEYNREYRKENADRIKEYNKEYRKENADRARERNRKYYKENSDRFKECKKEYYKENADRIRERHRKYYKENKSAYVEHGSKRRAAKINRTPLWLTDDCQKTIRLYYDTRQSLTEATGTEYHVDHIIPLQGNNVSGLHVPQNLQIIKAERNISKGNRY